MTNTKDSAERKRSRIEVPVEDVFVCDVCGSDEYIATDLGLLVCDVCGATSQAFREEQADVHMPGVMMAGYRAASQLAIASQEPPELDPRSQTVKQEIVSEEAMASEKALLIAITRLLRAQVRWVLLHSHVQCSEQLESASKNLLEGLVLAAKKDILRFDISVTLGLLYLACMTCREAVLPTDIEQWVQQEGFPYMLARDTLGPEVCNHRAVLMALPPEEGYITARKLRCVTREVAIAMGGVPNLYNPSCGFGGHVPKMFMDLPVGNPGLILIRYIYLLSLPGTLIPIAQKLRALRLSAVHAVAFADDVLLTDAVFRMRAPPHILCSELELMSDVINAVRLNPQVIDGTLQDAESPDSGARAEILKESTRSRALKNMKLHAEEVLNVDDHRLLMGDRLREFSNWCLEVSFAAPNEKPSELSREMASLARETAKRRANLGRVAGLQYPASAGPVSPASAPFNDLCDRALEILRLGIDNKGTREAAILRGAVDTLLQVCIRFVEDSDAH